VVEQGVRQIAILEEKLENKATSLIAAQHTAATQQARADALHAELLAKGSVPRKPRKARVKSS
jgi:hypothetical protein